MKSTAWAMAWGVDFFRIFAENMRHGQYPKTI
jgi:hypothetical protein